MEGVLINDCYGGFSFSKEFEKILKNELNLKEYFSHEDYRDHPFVIKTFIEKGSDWMSGRFSKLFLVEVPTRMMKHYRINEYDGMESIYLLRDKAIADMTREYLQNPTIEKLDKLKEEIKLIDSLELKFSDE